MRVGASFCPGIVHAVSARDGLLIRIRIPGGLLHAGQLRAVASASAVFADGQIEITSRANLQLRGIEAQHLPNVIDALTAAGLLPSSQHDRVRNIVSSPLAGLDPDEHLDTRPLVRELDQRLITDARFAELHPKFSFAINGGGKWFSRETDDLVLRARNDHATLLLQLFIAGVDTGFAVTADHAVACLLEAARACDQLAKQFDVPARTKKIMAIPEAREELMRAVSRFLLPSSSQGDCYSICEVPLGLYPERVADRVTVIPCIPLGRLTVEQATSISTEAMECDADLRFAPWRGMVLGSVPKHLASRVVAALETVALRCDGQDGFQGIAACAGNTGCDAALADVRGDAAALARQLAGKDLSSGWTVNFSGCEKQCAMRQGASAELIAHSDGYMLRLDGQLATSIYSPESALQAILSARSQCGSISEVVS